MAVLVNITESLKHQCPLDFDLDICDKLNIPQDAPQIAAKDFSLEREYCSVGRTNIRSISRSSDLQPKNWASEAKRTSNIHHS